MIRSILLVIFYLSTVTVSFTQDWTSSVKWVYEQTFLDDQYYIIQKTGDILIENKQSIIVQEMALLKDDTLFWREFILHQSDAKVFIYEPSDSSFKLYLDYSLNLGDTLHSYCNFKKVFTPYLINKIGEIDVEGRKYKTQNLRSLSDIDCILQSPIIENIGSEKLFSPSVRNIDPTPGGKLLCYQEGGKTVYGIESGLCEITTSTSVLPVNSIDVYPNPVSEILHIKTEEKGVNKLFDIAGNLIISNQSKTINFSKYAKGIYIFQRYQNEKVFTQKIVKAY